MKALSNKTGISKFWIPIPRCVSHARISTGHKRSQPRRTPENPGETRRTPEKRGELRRNAENSGETRRIPENPGELRLIPESGIWCDICLCCESDFSKKDKKAFALAEKHQSPVRVSRTELRRGRFPTCRIELKQVIWNNKRIKKQMKKIDTGFWLRL